ncbi:MAG: putative polymerase sigma factor, subfamily [Myxococcaceae bacterium]|nr:putative polymerase sigma factor, subfamily [Myxococcaceae bacterium]
MEDVDRLAALAEQALAGHRLALEELCRELQGPLYRLALRVLGDPEDAKDATQEALARVITHLSQFRSESRLLTWAYAIASRHFLRTRARRQQIRQVEHLEQRIVQGLSSTEQGFEAADVTPAQVHETRIGCTQAMLQCLNMEERLALVLSEVLGADDKLGAWICDTTQVSFRKRLSRARNKLRPILEQLCGLASERAPCNCTRQACAKQRFGGLPAPVWTKLPLADERAIAVCEQLGRLRAGTSLFAISPPPEPPAELWRELSGELRRMLSADP